MRSINIDMTSVRFCTPEMIDRFRKIHLLRDYIDSKEQELVAYNTEHDVLDDGEPVNGRRQTNLGVFRAYLERYLREQATVNTDMMLMIRHLQPTPTGIPIQLYFFSNRVEWTAYERVQSDVFDHVLAVIPEFGLRVFQSPSGSDVQRLRPDLES